LWLLNFGLTGPLSNRYSEILDYHNADAAGQEGDDSQMMDDYQGSEANGVAATS